MSKQFRGLYTALITPFKKSGEIDYLALEKLIEEQIAAKVDGLVILGTTGESPVINKQERTALTKFVLKQVKKRIQVILGTGSNNTQDSIAKSQEAEKLGVDAILVVNPYYNKPTQEGLFQHFSTIANSVAVPIILYNIQGRTAVNLETETLLRLAVRDNIVAVKEASGNITQMMDVIRTAPPEFSVLSGDDSLAYPLIALGGDGVVSVLGNLLPNEMKQMIELALTKNYDEALNLHYKMQPLMRALLSIGNNPTALKTVLAWQGKIKEAFRLPLCPLPEAQKSQLRKICKKNRLI